METFLQKEDNFREAKYIKTLQNTLFRFADRKHAECLPEFRFRYALCLGTSNGRNSASVAASSDGPLHFSGREGRNA